ncbi:MAG: hypothetical protein PHU77_00425 [Simplicispira sp.]|nr:hypothetical protein [Simplicispira sp.]
MQLASYKFTRPGMQGVANRLIRLRLRGIYSHSEVVFQSTDGVDQFMPDGTCAPDENGALWCASSVAAERLPAHSPRRAGRLGGVRFKRIVLDPDHWDVLPYRRDPVAAARWFKAHEGSLYDWQLIIGFLAWVVPQKDNRSNCSEASAAAGGAADPWRFDPCVLHAAVAAEGQTK